MADGDENKDSSRRRFIRKLTTLGAASGVAALLSGAVTEKPLIPLAQAASGDYLSMDNVNTAAGTTQLTSTLTTANSGAAFVAIASTDTVDTVGVRGIATAAGGTSPCYTSGLEGYASAGSGPVQGVYGHTDSPDGAGVWGVASSVSGQGAGIGGFAYGSDAAGVFGRSFAALGWAAGVAGRTDSPEGNGVWGRNFATASSAGMSPTGVYGRTDAGGGPWPDGPFPNGVWGYASGGTGATTGAYGVAESPDGAGMWGENYADSGRSVGVGGVSHSQEGIGVYGLTYAPSSENMQPVSVYGQADAAGGDPNIGNGPWPTGVMGYASAASGETRGVQGIVESTAGYGVQGTANASEGWAVGVWGGTNSVDGVGIRGRSNPSGGTWEEGPWPVAISGYAAGASGATTGVLGQSDSPIGIGVYGRVGAGTGWAIGVEGDTGSEEGGAGVVGFAYATSGYNAGVYGGSNAPGGAGVQGDANGPSGIGVLGHARDEVPDAVPIIAWAASGQTGSLQQWVRNDWTPLAVVDAAGQFGIGTATPARQLHIVGSNAVARIDRNVDSASFIFVRTNTDYSQVLKTFTFGVKATGVDSGSFFIGDMHTNVSGSSDNRLLIDTSGNVGIGTTTPSSKLHVNGRVKAKGYDTGDITYANGVRSTEDGDGIAYYNPQGVKIARLDAQGNLQVKGKITENPDL